MEDHTFYISSDKIARRREALRQSSFQTRKIQTPIINPFVTRGHPNPSGLGNPVLRWWSIRDLFREVGKIFRRPPIAQSSVLFSDLATYQGADEKGCSPYGGAEYAIALSPEADAVCQKMAGLYHGFGAVLCPSGLSAITTTLNAFRPDVILLPDNVYFPMERFLKEGGGRTKVLRYPTGASSEEFNEVLARNKAMTSYDPSRTMVYLEAPGSGTFEIPDIEGISQSAKKNTIRVVMDNTWGSFVRCDPFKWGVDIVIEATTKYAGGYGDTPSGLIIAAQDADYKKLARELRITGNGAVASVLCNQLNFRVDSTQARMDQHYKTSLQLMNWFSKQDFVAEVVSPALETSPYHQRFVKYFGQGNGLFSIVFKEQIQQKQVDAFNDALNFFHVGESWGGHVSLVLPVHARHELSEKPQGVVYRYHAGLEDPKDLLRDLDQAVQRTFGQRPGNLLEARPQDALRAG